MKNFTKYDAIDTLHSEKCSCVVLNDGKMSVYRSPGISDLLRLLADDSAKLDGAFVADKALGRAAASLLILGNVAEAYADIISEGALELLCASNIEVTYEERVPAILNRSKEGLCPMEKLCMDAADAEECYRRIKSFIADKNK